MSEWHEYAVTVKHDDGQTTIWTSSYSEDAAIELVVQAELCPAEQGRRHDAERMECDGQGGPFLDHEPLLIGKFGP